jgi:hypothetical protein
MLHCNIPSLFNTNQRNTTMFNFDEITKANKANFDAFNKGIATFSKGYQAIANEVVDYAKTSFETGKANFETLSGVKTLEKALELNTEAGKAAYEAAVAKATKISELATDLAKEAYKPFEAAVAQAVPAAKGTK